MLPIVEPRSILPLRDNFLDALAMKTVTSAMELLHSYSGQCTTLSKDVIGSIVTALHITATPQEHDAIFHQLQQQCSTVDGALDFESLCLLARRERDFTAKQKLSLRAANVFGNPLLSKFETDIRKKTNQHVREHARVAVGDFSCEDRRRLGGIVTHRERERQAQRDRSRAMEGTYERLRLPRCSTSSSLVMFGTLSPSPKSGRSSGSFASSLASPSAHSPANAALSRTISLPALRPAVDNGRAAVRDLHTPATGLTRERVRRLAQQGVYLDVDSLRRCRA